MSISRSDECYFPRADLVIQVENTLFKLHQDILERHSGFFEDMFSVPTNDDTEGTEENPLVLPSDLCSARSFTMICKLLYPSNTSFHRIVSVNQVEEWESVLRATAALQMNSIREYILAKLCEDVPNVKSNVAKLLRLSLDYEESPSSFPVACLRILAYRRQRLTPDEVVVLGGKGTCLVNHAREEVREALSRLLVKLIQQPQTKNWINLNGTTNEHTECIMGSLFKMLEYLPESSLQKTDDTDDIFHDISDQIPCDTCASAQKLFIQMLKDSLYPIVDLTIERVL